MAFLGAYIYTYIYKQQGKICLCIAARAPFAMGLGCLLVVMCDIVAFGRRGDNGLG